MGMSRELVVWRGGGGHSVSRNARLPSVAQLELMMRRFRRDIEHNRQQISREGVGHNRGKVLGRVVSKIEPLELAKWRKSWEQNAKLMRELIDKDD